MVSEDSISEVIQRWKREQEEAYPDLKDWCEHFHVSLRTWTCPDCGRALSETAKQRLLNSNPIAPSGHLWILEEQTQPEYHYADLSPEIIPYAIVFTDRRKIARQMVKDRVFTAKELREELAQVHWYQSVRNEQIYEGWDEGAGDELNPPKQYRLRLVKIDSA